MQSDRTFKILIAGLEGVGKKTIIQRFQEGYEEFKHKIDSNQNLKDGEDKLVNLDIELESHTITSRQIDEDEYISKKPNKLKDYKIIVIVFDLGEKDSIKQLANHLLGSSLNFQDVGPYNKCALWGNKKDLFNFDENVDQRNAQKIYDLEYTHKMVGYVNSNSINLQINEPFQCVSKLIQQYLDWVQQMNNPVSNLSAQSSTIFDSNSQVERQEIIKERPINKNKKRDLNGISIGSLSKDKDEIPVRSDKKKSHSRKSDKVFTLDSSRKQCNIF